MNKTDKNVPINEQLEAKVASLLALMQWVIATVAGGVAHINVVAATVKKEILNPGIKLSNNKNTKFNTGATISLINE